MYKRTSQYLGAFGAAMLIFTVVLFYLYRQSKIEENLSLKIDLLDVKNNELRKLVLLHSEHSHLKFTSGNKLTDVNNNVFTWNTISLTSKLVFRFSQKNCIECVRAQIPFLKNISDKIGKDKVILLTSYDNRRDLMVILNEFNLDFKSYNISIDEFSKYNNSIENLGIPYVFEINADGEVEMLFFPLKETPEISKLYYRRVEERMKKSIRMSSM